MLPLQRNTVWRAIVVYSMVVSTLAVAALPFLQPWRDNSSDTAVEWLRKRLQITADAEFDRAVRVALAASPRSFDDFVDTFVDEYEAGDSIKGRLAGLFGFSAAPAGHLLVSGIVSAQSVAVVLRKKKPGQLAHFTGGKADLHLVLFIPSHRFFGFGETVSGALGLLAVLVKAYPNGP